MSHGTQFDVILVHCWYIMLAYDCWAQKLIKNAFMEVLYKLSLFIVIIQNNRYAS